MWISFRFWHCAAAVTSQTAHILRVILDELSYPLRGSAATNREE